MGRQIKYAVLVVLVTFHGTYKTINSHLCFLFVLQSVGQAGGLIKDLSTIVPDQIGLQSAEQEVGVLHQLLALVLITVLGLKKRSRLNLVSFILG